MSPSISHPLLFFPVRQLFSSITLSIVLISSVVLERWSPADHTFWCLRSEPTLSYQRCCHQTQTGCGDTHLQSQHSGGGGHRVRPSRLSSATCWIWSTISNKQTNNSQNKNRQIYYLGLKFSIYSLVIMSNRASVSSSVIHLHPGQIYSFGQWQSFNHNLDTPFKRFCHSICCSPQPTGQNLCKNHSWLLPVLDPTPNSTRVIELTLPSPHLTGLPRAPSCWQWPKLSFLMFISFTLTPS